MFAQKGFVPVGVRTAGVSLALEERERDPQEQAQRRADIAELYGIPRRKATAVVL